MRTKRFLVSICLLISLAQVAFSQQNVTSGTLSGRIEDSSGAVVSGANITVTNLETNQRLTTSTDAEGGYRFPYLRTGDYDVHIEAQGFTAVSYNRLTVSVGQSLELPVKLEVAGVSAQVNIGRTDVPLIETVRDRKSTRLNSSH